jgi:uncharacterized protein YukE
MAMPGTDLDVQGIVDKVKRDLHIIVAGMRELGSNTPVVAVTPAEKHQWLNVADQLSMMTAEPGNNSAVAQAASGYRPIGDNIGQNKDQLISDVRAVDGLWDGHAYTTFTGRTSELHRSYATVQPILGQIGDYLFNLADSTYHFWRAVGAATGAQAETVKAVFESLPLTVDSATTMLNAIRSFVKAYQPAGNIYFLGLLRLNRDVLALSSQGGVGGHGAAPGQPNFNLGAPGPTELRMEQLKPLHGTATDLTTLTTADEWHILGTGARLVPPPPPPATQEPQPLTPPGGSPTPSPDSPQETPSTPVPATPSPPASPPATGLPSANGATPELMDQQMAAPIIA